MIDELAHIDDRTGAPAIGSVSAGDWQCDGDVFARDESGPGDLDELIRWAVPRSPHRAGRLNVSGGLFSPRRMQDVGEHGAIELMHFDSDDVRAVVGDCVEKITKECPTPRGIRRWRREVAPVVDDAHHAALVDIDAGKWKVDGWYGRSLSGPAIDHARQVRDTHPVWSYVRLAFAHT